MPPDHAARSTLEALLPTWSSITWLGDSSLMLPAAALVGLALALSRRCRPLAPVWAWCFGTVGLAVLVTKVAFVGWGLGIARLDFTGISGHAALACAFWPVAGWLAAAHWGRFGGRIAAGAGLLLALAISASRLALHAHSLSEVVAGFLVGTAAAGLFLIRTRRHPVPSSRTAAICTLAMLGVALLAHDRLAPMTWWIQQDVPHLLGKAGAFTRRDLHRTAP